MRWTHRHTDTFKAIKRVSRALSYAGRPAWIVFAVIGAAALVAAAWGIGGELAPLALKADTTIAELRDLSVLDSLDADVGQIDVVQTAVQRIADEVGPATWTANVFERTAPAVAWVPGIDQEVSAWATQVRRLDSDLDSASTLLSGSSQLLSAYRQAQATMLSAGDSPSSTPLGSIAGDTESSFAAALKSLAQARERGRRRKPLLMVGGTVTDSMALLEEVEGRMATALGIGQRSSALLADVAMIRESAGPLVAALMDIPSEEERLTAEGLRTTVASLDQRLGFALSRARGLGKLVAGAGYAGAISGRLELVEETLEALLVVSRATMLGIELLEPLLQQAQAPSSGVLTGGEGLLLALSQVAAREDDLSNVVLLLEDAQQRLGQLAAEPGGSQSAATVGALLPVVETLGGGLRFLRDIAPVGVKFAGGETARSYLVLGQSADELRATGGFVSSIWLVNFENGRLLDTQYHDVVRVDDWERLDLYPKAPAGLEEHMHAPVWLLRDVSWEPDFPTTARTAADMFLVGQRKEVDGVIALNQWTLLDIVEAVGSIPSPGGGEEITTRNFFAKLEEGSDQHGRAYMDLTLQGFLSHVDDSVSLPTLLRLGKALQRSLDERDLLLYLDDSDAQTLVEERGWDGRVRRDVMDYLYVVDSNVGWSKADRNIQRTVTYRVDLRKEPGPRISLSLGYNNHSGPGSPPCEPQDLNKENNYTQLKNACYWNYWRAYVPLGVRLLSNTPLPLAEYSVSAMVGKGLPGEDTLKVSSGYGRTVLSGLFPLEAGETNQVDLVYDLPAQALRREGNRLRYELLIQKQPGSRSREVKVEFVLPDGYSLEYSSVEPDDAVAPRVEFSIHHTRDTVLSTVFARNDDESG